jgi:hypothetical protein
MRSLLGNTRLERQRNPDIHDRLKGNNPIQDIKLYKKSWLDHLQRMNRSRLPRLNFQYQPRGRRDAGRPGKDGKFKNTLSFKRTGLKKYPLFMFMEKIKCQFSIIFTLLYM